MSTIQWQNNGENLSIGVLKVAQIIELDRAVYDHAREQMIADLEAAGADETTRLRELRDLARSKGSDLNRLAYAVTAEGAAHVIGMAGQDVEALTNGTLERARLAVLLLGEDPDLILNQPDTGEDPT